MKARAVPEPEPTKMVGLWLRVSTEDQAKGESPEHHERRGRESCPPGQFLPGRVRAPPPPALW